MEQGCDPGGERLRAECDQVAIEIAAFGDDDGGRNAQFTTAPPEAFGGALAFRVVVAGDDEADEAGRRREGAEASGGERGGGDCGDRGDQGEHGLDALADEQGVVAGGAEADGAAMDMAEGFARACDLGFGRRGGVEPGTVDAVDGAVVACDGGDERRQASEAVAVAIVEGGMEAE